jgi:nucleotide-binding universal stress UspA family protein
VVVAVDGSQDAVLAARAVSARTWPEYSTFRVVSVIDPRLETAIAWPEAGAAAWMRDTDTGAKEAVCRALEHSAKILADAGLTVETHLLTGDPKHELLKHAEAWEADSIFLGARGLHHGGRLTLGTMASAIAARAHCSVEISRPG